MVWVSPGPFSMPLFQHEKEKVEEHWSNWAALIKSIVRRNFASVRKLTHLADIPEWKDETNYTRGGGSHPLKHLETTPEGLLKDVYLPYGDQRELKVGSTVLIKLYHRKDKLSAWLSLPEATLEVWQVWVCQPSQPITLPMIFSRAIPLQLSPLERSQSFLNGRHKCAKPVGHSLLLKPRAWDDRQQWNNVSLKQCISR